MYELIPLSNANLKQLPKNVRTPRYDRSKLKPGIVHIGLGNFHRAHQAWYLHRLMDDGLCHDWAIIGAGIRPHDAKQRELMLAQDCLTTLIELDPSGKSAEVIGPMIDYIPVEDGNRSLVSRMAQPDISIVSLTVTEGGYYTNQKNGGFDADHADIAHDVANPETPRTVFGAIIAALKKRRDTGAGPFTCQSCDNLQGNGKILHRTIVSLAQMSDPALGNWIENNCSFPNSMVDCIVPATGIKELTMAQEIGIADMVPVTHENFRQWVIEDNFCAGRPEWNKVGAVFSDKVHEYETMKLRILNGGHQIIAITGDLLGIKTISGAMENKNIHAMLRKTIQQEVAANVKPVLGMTPLEYLDLIDRRFSNTEIVDTTRRVAFDGSSRQPGFIVPSIRDALSTKLPFDGLAMISALWARYCLGKREDGSLVEPNDPNWDELNNTALATRDEPSQWLKMSQYYGDLAEEPHFLKAFERWYKLIAKGGVESAVSAFIST